MNSCNKSVVGPFHEQRLDWLSEILTERLGEAITLVSEDGFIVMSIENCVGSLIFCQVQDEFSQVGTRPNFHKYDPGQDGLVSPLECSIPTPTFSEFPTRLFVTHEKGGYIFFDILGLIFWVLGRVEEIGVHKLDSHSRVPSAELHSCLYSYYDRPIIDEWLDILKQIMLQVWPSLTPRSLKSSIRVSHDVDRPSYSAYDGWFEILRITIGNLLRGDLKKALLGLYIKLFTRSRFLVQDPYNTFSWLMTESERRGLVSEFFFLAGGNNQKFDGNYELSSPEIQALIRDINNRGHLIGLHPSYETYKSLCALKSEFSHIRNIIASINKNTSVINSRMHYLRFEWPTTIQILNSVGLASDSSLGFSDRPGFRCGTARPYRAFDPVQGITLDIIIRPLLFMESSIDLHDHDAINKALMVKKHCFAVNGIFEILWHNSSLDSQRNREIYCLLVGED